VFPEQEGHNSGEKSSTELTAVLADSNGFDLSYLTENSQGVLAGGQINLLLMPLLTSLLFVLFPIAVIVFQLNTQGFLKKLSSGFAFSALLADLPKGLLVIGGILLIITLLGLYYLISSVLDILSRTVEVIEGIGKTKVTISSDSDGDTTTKLFYVIDNRQFRVKKKAYLVFEQGRRYRAYYTPRRKVLVNIEVLD
jgi:hypothetical protein